MATQMYEITGRVIEAKTRQGLSNLVVEAWDKDEKYNDLLGQTFTNDAGQFSFSFDGTYFRDYDPESNPDLLFKVFMGKKLLKSTADAVIKNAGPRTEVTIEINMPEMRKEGKDRVNTQQVFKAANFLQQSDFKGVFNQFKSKAGTSFGFLSDMVMNTVTKLNIQPIKVGSVRNENIVGQDVNSATEHLESQNVIVNDVKTYEPQANRASLSEFKSFPANLKEGQKVNLYQENGRVRYYSLVKENAAENNAVNETGDKAFAARSRNTEMNSMTEELNMAKKSAAEKDEQISKLQDEMAALRKDHEEIRTMLQSDALKKLMENQADKPVKAKTKTATPAKRTKPK